MTVIRQFLKRIRTQDVRRQEVVKTAFLGRERLFEAYDIEDDTYIFEKSVERHLKEHPSVLVVEKCHLRAHAKGRVMTMSTGNHAVAALPLLNGTFWNLSNLPSDRCSTVLSKNVLCANIVGDAIELSQREVATADLVASDSWLKNVVGFSMRDVVMADRNNLTLDHYRRHGEEWRVKPLAWTETEMRVSLNASRKRIGTKICYYHSARGVHFLTYAEFCRFAALAETDTDAFVQALHELADVYEGNESSFLRMSKYRGHHEIEFFGLSRGVALQRLVPEVESLLKDVALARVGQLGVIQRVQEIASLYKSLLTHSDLADETSRLFTEKLYICITGEVYAVMGEGMTSAFDDRRTALPGATFVDGRPVLHPGADDRTEVLLSNLRGLMSKDEIIEYANVYELRTDDSSEPLGKGHTREVVYKTNFRPLENSLIEKRLSRALPGYGSYVLARIGALRSLGITLSDYYQMLKRRAGTGKRRPNDYYIRRRCEGETMDAIPATYFQSAEDTGVEDAEVVLALAALMGDAAAQNMAMKKYDPATNSPLYGIGKEIYEFEYDIVHERVVPKKVSTCSIRGSFGWPSLDYTDENLDAIARFYLSHFAAALKEYQQRHSTVALADLAERFMNGFEFRTQALEWQLSVMRDRFETFGPNVPARYAFTDTWRFVMWSLERQARRLPSLRKLFAEFLQTHGG